MAFWYHPYCQAVVRCLRHATAKERQEVSWELQCHLQDHADALEAAGYSPEQAQAHALEAMGDPQEVGSALDREFPLGWLMLSRSALALVLTGAALLVLLLPSQIYGCVNSLIARSDPLNRDVHFHDTDHTVETTAPLDVTFTLPNGDVIDLYGVILTQEKPGRYIAAVYAVCYNKNPFRTPYYGMNTLEGVDASGSPTTPLPVEGWGLPTQSMNAWTSRHSPPAILCSSSAKLPDIPSNKRYRCPGRR